MNVHVDSFMYLVRVYVGDLTCIFLVVDDDYDETRTDVSSSFGGGWCDGHLANDWEVGHWRRLARRGGRNGKREERVETVFGFGSEILDV